MDMLLIIFVRKDTARNSLSGVVRLLTEFPDQRGRVMSDRSLIDRISQWFVINN